MSQTGSATSPGTDRVLDWRILLPPAGALVLFAAGNDNFGFPPPGYLDAFVYIGYFWHYPEHLGIFENYYKASRLPWILPGFAMFWLFGEIAGSYVLHWVTLSAGGVAMYLLLRDSLKDRMVSALIGVAWVCSTTGHGAGGWNYHGLASATYYVVACWLIVRTASSSAPRAAVLAGAAFACAVHTYIVYLTLAPLALWLYLAALPRIGRREWIRVAIDLGWMAVGALGLTALLAAINAGTGGPWLFFMAQLRTTIALTQPGSNAWWTETGGWLPTAKYLVIPLLSLCAGIVSFLRPSADDSVQRMRRTFALQSWAILAILAYMYSVHQYGVLNYDYMSLGLYCHAFPALGAALLGRRDSQENAGAQTALLGGAVVIILGTLLIGMPFTLSTLSQKLAAVSPSLPLIVPPLVVGVATLLAVLALPKRFVIIAFAGWFSLLNAWATTSARSYGVSHAGIHREMLTVFRDMDAHATQLDPTLGAIEYWFTSKIVHTPQGPVDLAGVFNSYVSTRAWSGNLLAYPSPGLAVELLTPKHLKGVTCLGVLSSVEDHQALRAQFIGQFKETGPRLEDVFERQFQSAHLALAMTVFRVRDGGAASAAAAETSKHPCRP